MWIMVIILIAILGIYIFVSIKISNLKYRAKQHILKDTIVSSANINAEVQNAIGGKVEKKFLADFPNYTQESLYQLVQECAENIKKKNMTRIMSDKVKEKIEKDKKIDLINEKTYKRMIINGYGGQRLNATVIYEDNRDEYEIQLYYIIQENNLMLDEYTIVKGAVLGF